MDDCNNRRMWTFIVRFCPMFFLVLATHWREFPHHIRSFFSPLLLCNTWPRCPPAGTLCFLITALLSTCGWEIRSLQDYGKKKVLQNLIRRYYLTKHQRYLPCGRGKIWGEEEPKKSQQRRVWAGSAIFSGLPRLASPKSRRKISGVKVF